MGLLIDLKFLANVFFYRFVDLFDRFTDNRGQSLVVRPRGTPFGMKVFAFDWIEAEKRVSVSMPMTGTVVGNIPGKWGPRSLFSKAGHLIIQ